MPNYIAQVLWQASSGLPTDRFVNTFHFSGTGTLETDSVTMAARLDDLYRLNTPALNNIGEFMSNGIVSGEVRMYDMADPEPRVPEIVPLGALAARQTAIDLPREVAMVSSFHGDPPITPRRRGRVYLGPFNTGGNAATGIPTGGLINVAVAAFDRLAAASTADLLWVIYSPTTGLFVIVTGGFVDFAWDTMRSRGDEATGRTTWSEIVP